MAISISYLKNIGFISKLPSSAKVDDFEVIVITRKSGDNLKMYRRKKEQSNEAKIKDFTRSWTTFQQNLS